MTTGATCEQCSEDDETTTNGLPSKYRQYVTLSGIDFRTRTNICAPLQRSARQPRTHYCMRWMCLGPLSARQVWVGHWSSYKRCSSEYFNGSIVRKSWKINSGLESCHSSPTMGIRVFDRHNNFIILAVKSIGFGWEIVNHGGAIIFNGNLMDLVVFGWDLVRYVEISLIERISPHLVKKPTYRLKWRSLTVITSDFLTKTSTQLMLVEFSKQRFVVDCHLGRILVQISSDWTIFLGWITVGHPY